MKDSMSASFSMTDSQPSGDDGPGSSAGSVASCIGLARRLASLGEQTSWHAMSIASPAIFLTVTSGEYWRLCGACDCAPAESQALSVFAKFVIIVALAPTFGEDELAQLVLL